MGSAAADLVCTGGNGRCAPMFGRALCGIGSDFGGVSLGRGSGTWPAS